MIFIEEKKGMFHQDIIVPEYAFDMYDDLKTSYLQKIVQDTSSLHLNALGFSYEKLINSGYVYLLVYTKIKTYKKLKVWDEIRVVVWPKSSRGARSYRDIIIINKKREVIAEVSTVWVLADATNHKIVSPENSPVELTFVDDYPLQIKNAKKIKMPIDLVKVGEELAKFTDIDSNNHVNNTNYSDIFTNHAGLAAQNASLMNQADFYKEYFLQELNINYRNEIFFSENLDIFTAATENDGFINIYLRGAVGSKNSFDCAGIYKKRN